MAKATVSKNIGQKRDLEVRAGNDLTPQILFLALSSGQTLNAAGTEVLCRLFHADAITPILSPTFDVAELSPSVNGHPRVMVTLPWVKIEELLALAVPSSVRLPRAVTGVRTFFWSATLEDSLGGRRPLFYGKLRIMKGAASA